MFFGSTSTALLTLQCKKEKNKRTKQFAQFSFELKAMTADKLA